MNKKILISLITAMLMSFLIMGCTIVYDSENSDNNSSRYEHSGNIAENVKGIWENQMPGFIEENSIDITEAISMLRKNGNQVLCIDDTVFVKAFHDDSQMRTLELDNDANDSVIIQVGPVFKGTAIRDGLTFIEPDQYTNQVEYGAVSREFNKLVNEIALADIDLSEFVNQKIHCQGFITVRNGEMMITPVMLELAGE